MSVVEAGVRFVLLLFNNDKMPSRHIGCECTVQSINSINVAENGQHGIDVFEYRTLSEIWTKIGTIGTIFTIYSGSIFFESAKRRALLLLLWCLKIDFSPTSDGRHVHRTTALLSSNSARMHPTNYVESFELKNSSELEFKPALETVPVEIKVTNGHGAQTVCHFAKLFGHSNVLQLIQLLPK